MIKTVLKWPDPFLLKPTTDWDHQTPQLDTHQLEQDLIDTLIANKALGLAANQIGIPFRVIAINTQDDKSIRVMYNPMIILKSNETSMDFEGCLSFPKIRLEIPRNLLVAVSWRDKLNYVHSREFKNIDARCILHELDHLDGIVFKKYVSNLKFNHAQRQVL